MDARYRMRETRRETRKWHRNRLYRNIFTAEEELWLRNPLTKYLRLFDLNSVRSMWTKGWIHSNLEQRAMTRFMIWFIFVEIMLADDSQNVKELFRRRPKHIFSRWHAFRGLPNAEEFHGKIRNEMLINKFVLRNNECVCLCHRPSCQNTFYGVVGCGASKIFSIRSRYEWMLAVRSLVLSVDMMFACEKQMPRGLVSLNEW